jgi:hypothetical protein
VAVIILVPLLVAGIATGLGVSAGRTGRRWFTFVPIVLWSVFVVLLTIVARVEGVSDGAVASGAVIALFSIGLLPPLFYLAMGWFLARRPVVLAIVWVASLIPVAYYLFLAFIVVVGKVACTPDDYECPI